MRALRILLIGLTLSAPVPLVAQRLLGRPAAALAEADRIRLAESFRLAEALQDNVWPGWSRAPFAVLLVTPEHEFLVRHPAPTPDFERLGYDSLLASEVWVRRRVFPPNLLAAFPAVGGVPTVVIGQPEHTERSSTPWVLTVLHEHFHQLQTSHPEYYQRVEALDLAQGDRTGMWMLNYPFPYDSAVVQERFRELARSLSRALEAVGSPEFHDYVAAYRRAEGELRAGLSDRDARYLAFQLWQEGIARYTEDQVAQLAARSYTPTRAFRELPDFTPFSEAADSIRRGILRRLREPELGTRKRVAFYPLGAALGLLLDAATPQWKRHYFEEMFALERS
jgi:hypothetical protein